MKIRYRLALMGDEFNDNRWLALAQDDDGAIWIEKDQCFIKWINDEWQYVSYHGDGNGK